MTANFIAQSTSQEESEDNVEISLYDVSELREEFSDWDSLSKSMKMQRVVEVPAARSFSSRNTTCVGLNETLPDLIDTNQTTDERASHLAVGDDNTTPQSSNVNLNNEVFRGQVTDSSVSGDTLSTTTVIDSSEANGEFLREVGLVNQSSSSGDILFNHSTISEIEKTSDKLATIDVSLTFTSA